MHDHITGSTTFKTTIEVIIAPDGSSRVETKGFQGAECRDASRFLEQALGQQLSEQLTAEFHAVVTGQQQLSEGQ